jgi:hypothetical protein
MGPDHEYTILSGVNRAGIGRWIAVVAAGISSAIVFALLAIIDVAKALGVAPQLPTLILWPIGAGTIYVGLYWFFDRHLWRHPQVAKLLKLPDLRGRWQCKGQTINQDKTVAFSWSASMTITQSWDRLKIRLETETSISQSIAAALVHDEGGGFLVMYHYRNEPKATAPGDMRPHRGFGELTFSQDGKSATGEYFNGVGRPTFGTMTIEKIDG